MSIKWNRVTWYSQVVAIILFLAVFALGFWIGKLDGLQTAALAQEAAMDI